MRRLSFIAVLLPLALFALSCSEENPPTGPEGWQELSSPFNTLWDVRYSFNHFDQQPSIIDDFSSLIADDFIFYFDPDDIGDVVHDYTIPPFWTRDEFIRAVNNMFNRAYDITFDIPVLEQGEEAFGRPAEGDSTFLKSNVTISIIVMVDEQCGYQAQGFCDFKFIKGSDGFWRLSEWRDHTALRLLCTSSSSLGSILAMFN